MRWLSAICFCLIATFPLLAGEAEDLIKDALQAHAKDIATLKKQNIMTSKATGMMTLNGETSKASQSVQAVWPSQTLIQYEFIKDVGKSSMTLCVFNDRGWRRISGSPTTDLSLSEVNDCRQGTYAMWMLTLLPLLEGGSKFTMAPAYKANGESWPTIIVSRRNWPDVTMSFDATTKLLRRVSYKARESGVLRLEEIFLSDHSEVEGIKLPQTMQLTFDGKEVFKWTKIEYTFPEKLDRTIFDKP